MSKDKESKVKELETSLSECSGETDTTGFNELQIVARSLAYSPVNKLHDGENDIKVKDSTLGQFARLFERFDKRDFRISKFFA